MERIVASMIPETDARYIETREERSKQTKHELWGQFEVDGYERELVRLAEIEKLHTYLQDRLRETATNVASSADKEARVPLPKNPDEIEKRIAQLEKQRQQAVKVTQELMQRLFHQLLRQLHIMLLGDPKSERANFILDEIISMFSDPGLQQQLKTHLPKLTVGGIAKNIDKIPGYLLYAAVKAHQERMREWAEYTEQVVEETKKKFFSIARAEIEAGRLPVEISSLEKRLALVVGRLCDRLNEPTSSAIASYDADGVIYIFSSELSEENSAQLRANIFHELVHEISGKSIQLISSSGKPHTVDNVHDRKAGIEFMKRITKSRVETEPVVITKRFTWLNEAITEWYAMKLSGYVYKGPRAEVAYQGSINYVEERKELDRLFALGLPEELVIAAYFENIYEGQPEQKQGRAFAMLLRKIAEIEKNPHAFAALENKYALEKARELLRDIFVYPLQGRTLDEIGRSFPAGTQIFPITFSLGMQARDRVQDQFFYTETPDEKDANTLLARPDAKELLHIGLIGVRNRVGGARCQFTIGEPKIMEPFLEGNHTLSA